MEPSNNKIYVTKFLAIYDDTDDHWIGLKRTPDAQLWMQFDGTVVNTLSDIFCSPTKYPKYTAEGGTYCGYSDATCSSNTIDNSCTTTKRTLCRVKSYP